MVPHGALVVVPSSHVQPGLSQWQPRIIEVHQVRAILLEQVPAAQRPALHKSWIVRWRIFRPDPIVLLMPAFDLGDTLQPVGHLEIRAGVQVLWVKSLPPFALAVFTAQYRGVITGSGQWPFAVIAVSGLKPMPGMSGVIADAKAESGIARRLGPDAYDVLLGPDVYRVPRMVSGIERVEVVVMIGKRDEVLGTGVTVQLHQSFGFPGVGFPQVIEFHEAETAGMAIVLDVIVVGRLALLIHHPRIPVALLRDALCAPMRPDPEFRIAKPFGDGVLSGERIPVGLKRGSRGARSRQPQR